MADVKKIATRVSYGEALVELANEHDDFVVLDADLAAATQTGKFKAACPDRFFDVGIAESNLMGVAAGIATTGRVAFASTFAMFAAGRAFEQVRNSIGYPHLNVKIGATHAGISVGEDGATHQCCEDIALMRVIPGMTVIVPADDVEARAVTRAAYECDGPVYMRFARLASPVINDPETYKFELGKGIVMREGADVTIIACGLMVGEALEAAEQLAAEGIDAEVINMHTIKPIDADLIVKSATKTGHVVTVEEHSVIGGLGSAVADVLCEQCPTPLKKIGVNDTFGESGPGAEPLPKSEADPFIVTARREACHHNLYAIANSCGMNGVGADTTIKVTRPTVVTMSIIIACAFTFFCLLGIVMWIIGGIKFRKTEEYKAYKDFKKSLKASKKA